MVRSLEAKPAVQGVVYRGGAPLAGARVAFGRSAQSLWDYVEDETVTDAAGRFRLARALPGEATLRIDDVSVSVKVPSERLSLTVR